MSKIIIIAPAPIEGSGGVARIYNFARALADHGHDCHLHVFNPGGASAERLAADAMAFYQTGSFTLHAGLDTVRGMHDLVIATRWDTPAMALKIEARRRAYLIQDYEAYFNPVGDASLFGENSYMLGLKPLTYGRWLASKLARDFGNDAYHFDFASDTETFCCQIPMERRLSNPQSLVFVYQADKTRRCPWLGIEALGIVKHYRPHVSLNFVGSNDAPSLWYEFNNVGNLTIDELNALYNRSHVGLSLSSSNPSCNAFDMMAAGLPSVDLYRENNLYDVPAQGVLLAYQSAESIAEAIIHLLDHPDELLTRSKAGIDFMGSRSQRREVESFLSAVEAILAGDGDHRGQGALHDPFYDQPPVVAKVNRNAFVDAYLRKQLPEIQARKGWFGWGRQAALPATLAYYPTDFSWEPLSRPELVPSAPVEEPLSSDEKLARRLIRRHGLDPRLHTAMFDAAYYLENNRDVAEAGLDPFRHFLRHGIVEDRSPSPFFEKAWYDLLHPEDQRDGMSAIGHYLTWGSRVNQAPNSVFDPIWYLARNADVKALSVHPLHHYICNGEAERRDPSERFSTVWYADTNTDVMAQRMSPLAHYIRNGRSEGRSPLPLRHIAARESWQSAGRLIAGEQANIFIWRAKEADYEPGAGRVQVDILDAARREGQVSFDVWNTIIHRRCHPDEIKLRSARFLLLTAWDDIRPALRSPVHLMSARMRAENASAPRGDYEYRYSDAIALWLRDALVPSSNALRREELATALIDHEFAAESGSIELDENIGGLIRSLRKAPVFISDFYMESSFVGGLLAHVGVGGHFARGYASCDMFKNKRSGELFTHVLHDFEMAPADLIHIGDNPLADLERPVSMGIEAVPYVSAIDEERNAWYGKAFHQFCGGNPATHHRRMMALVESAAASLPTGVEDEALFDAGCRIGVLTFGYCLNIMQDAILRGAKEVVFFAREGILFKKIYDLIAAQDPFNTVVPPSRLLYVSRRATFAPSLRRYDSEEFMRLWTMYWRQSPVAFASSLNLDQAKAAAAARRAGLVPDEMVSAPWSDSRFQAFVHDPAFEAYAIDHLAQQRALLSEYLAQEIDLGANEVFIADIGWRGTIQDNLAHLLGKPLRGHYLALFGYLNAQAQGSKVGWLSDSNIGGDYSLPDQVAPIEMLFNGPGGSTIGYERHHGRIEPLREIFTAEEACVEALAPCRAGMEAVAPLLARYVRLHGLMAEDLHDLNCKVASDILTTPPAAIAEIFGRLEHNETFGVGAVEAMAEVVFSEVVATPAGPGLHHALQAWLGNRWPAGMARRPAVADWWSKAGPEALASAPIAISKAHSPAILKATGSRIAVYVPEPLEASGGYRTIMNTIKALVGVGFNADIYIERLEEKGALVEEYLGDTPATIVTGWHGRYLRAPTLALATIANSADFVARDVTAHHKGYLVQDDERAFHPLSDASVLAENSYAYGLHHFTIGNWLTHLIRGKYGAAAYPAGLGVDTGTYRLLGGAGREQAICILYQPEKARRACSIALRAAEIVQRARPDVTIYVYGSHAVPDLDCRYVNLGLINDLAELNALYNRCQAGVCLSLSNPSRIPFEMAAAGCQPVDLYRYNNLMDHIDGMSLLAFQSAESVAAALLQALGNPAETAEAVAGYMQHRTLAWESDAIVSNIVRLLDGRPDEDWALQPSFRGAPILAASDDMRMANVFCQEQYACANA